MNVDGKVVHQMEIPLDEKLFPKINIESIRDKVASYYTKDEFKYAIKTCKIDLVFKLDEKK